ncbi:hypothetical protein Uis1B_0114 [Bifidobacterium margollesii]|uniref:FHA domain-containing protein n=1 Tax=Bifidobacterium margollesii TaxID=2020964 RepID=A0A2N5JCT8_9BIFI|nr:FHA domain-containing protein [Bifidobacterium margollesii]PLS32022.1 hypothetical protein Uis1B_0114 [Bifidobacterium margollesii]
MSDQQWLIRVNGVDEMRVDAGQHVVIGRKPLRPAPAEEGSIRLDVPDLTKSMSKRHARFSVAESGNASVEDLGSTNGTYVVRDDGELMRVPVNRDFLLPKSPMRFQFGDVPVDFVKVEVEETPAAKPVADLFSYAKPGAVQEADVDPANMSVDDILDLRAGEPTGLLSTSKVRSRIDALHDQAVEERRQSEDAGRSGKEEPAGTMEAPGAGNLVDSAEAAAEHGDGDGTEEDRDGSVDAERGAVEQSTVEQDSRDLFQDAAAAQPSRSDSQTSRSDSQPAYEPVFEAGSVFDRLSKGELNKPEPGIVVDGLSSDDAKITRDFDIQFEMAGHPQLLPFLAMNPSLYDDLYAWLEVQGNPDIDRALAGNPGYQEYQKAKGE